MTNAVQKAMEAAKTAETETIETVQDSEGSYAAPAIQANPRSLADLVANSADVGDAYMGIEKGDGLTNSNLPKSPIKAPFLVEIDTDDCQTSITVVNKDGDQYHKSFDGGATHAETGENWNNFLAKFKQAFPDCRTYDSIRIQMRPVEDVLDGKEVIFDSSEVFTRDTPSTETREFMKIIRKLAKEDNLGKTILVEVSEGKRSNKNFKWSVINYELKEVVDA